MIYYYLTVYPMEALIASQLEPRQFGFYMSRGTGKGSAERLIFMEIEPRCSEAFDWNHAEKHCVTKESGDPKHSVYLSVYRVLEHIPLEAMKTCHLVTRDGMSLPIEKDERGDCGFLAPYFLYQEICPVAPLAVSALNPSDFADHIINGSGKISLPAMVFVDIKVIDLNDLEHSGNVGAFYDRNTGHLKECLSEVRSPEGKKTKIVDRSYASRFSYQVIGRGIFAARGKNILCYPMPDHATLKQIDYDWGRSAMIF